MVDNTASQEEGETWTSEREHDNHSGLNRRSVLWATATAAGAGTFDSVVTDGAAKQEDHQAVLDLVPASEATHTATASGNWQDDSIWDIGVPGDGARVHVPEAIEVTVDREESARLHWLRVDGTVQFDPVVDTQLRVDTIVTTHGSTFRMGTESTPVKPDRSAQIEFLDRGPIDTEWDPIRVSRGLLTFGRTEIYGAETTTWTTLDQHATAGDTAIVLSNAPTNWTEGDELVLPGQRPPEITGRGADSEVTEASIEDEEVTIASIDGRRVTLDRALEYDHLPAKESFDSYVLKLNRNVTFASENTDVPRRGHVMYHSRETDVHYLELKELGRTDKSYPFTNPAYGTPPEDVSPNPRARYALHFHRIGWDRSDRPGRVVGASVRGSPGWGIVNHGSYAEVESCTTYRVFGSHFHTEVGIEQGYFENNFALRSHGSGEQRRSRAFENNDEPGAVDDFGHTGNGFWIQGPGVHLEGNVAAGHRDSAFELYHEPILDPNMMPDEPADASGLGGLHSYPLQYLDGQEYFGQFAESFEGDQLVGGRRTRVEHCRNNTAFASGKGLSLSWHQYRTGTFTEFGWGEIEGLTAYHIGGYRTDKYWGSGPIGLFQNFSGSITYRNCHLVGDGEGTGIKQSHAYQARFVDCTVEGWDVGIVPPKSGGPVEISECTLENETDIFVEWTGARYSNYTTAATYWLENNEYNGETVLDGQLLNSSHLQAELSPQNYIRLDGQRVYFDEQAPENVPYPSKDDVPDEQAKRRVAATAKTTLDPSDVVGKTNQQLQNDLGVSTGGALLPDSAESRPDITNGYVDQADPVKSAWPIRNVESAGPGFNSVDILQDGSLMWIDRGYHGHNPGVRYDEVDDALESAFYIRTHPRDGQLSGEEALTFDLTVESDVYVTYTPFEDSATAHDDSWEPVDDQVTGFEYHTSENLQSMELYRKTFDAGTVSLSSDGGGKMYGVVVDPNEPLVDQPKEDDHSDGDEEAAGDSSGELAGDGNSETAGTGTNDSSVNKSEADASRNKTVSDSSDGTVDEATGRSDIDSNQRTTGVGTEKTGESQSRDGGDSGVEDAEDSVPGFQFLGALGGLLGGALVRRLGSAQAEKKEETE